MCPVQETLIRAHSPDAVVTDVQFMWNVGVCDGLGVPCVTFNVIVAFSTIAMRHLLGRVSNSEPEVVTTIPRFPAPRYECRRLAHVSGAQLDELTLGLEASGMVFLWVVRTDKWSPPERWHERVGGRGMVATAWAPQRAILAHRAVGAFVTHYG
uniref:Anthocyanin 3'-O-beta-glucosyltransferase n=1 Tax=Aegilops tauschii TaxID=37682 RepID=M8CNX1_AEGTA